MLLCYLYVWPIASLVGKWLVIPFGNCLNSVVDYKGCCFCEENQFLCANRKCIPGNWICNGNNDCGDGSDELAEICKGHSLNINFPIIS